jgi:hypothetical protein
VRRVFGRLRNVEVPGQAKLWHFELTKAGLVARRRGQRRASASTVTFERLAAGAGVEVKLENGERFAFALGASGLEITQYGRRPKMVGWEALANLGRVQMEMFPQLVHREVA